MDVVLAVVFDAAQVRKNRLDRESVQTNVKFPSFRMATLIVEKSNERHRLWVW